MTSRGIVIYSIRYDLFVDAHVPLPTTNSASPRRRYVTFVEQDGASPAPTTDVRHNGSGAIAQLYPHPPRFTAAHGSSLNRHKSRNVWNPFARSSRSPSERVRQVSFDQNVGSSSPQEPPLLVPVTHALMISDEKPVLDKSETGLLSKTQVLLLRTKNGEFANIFIDPSVFRLTKIKVMDILRHVPNIAPVISMGTMQADDIFQTELLVEENLTFITVMSDCDHFFSKKDVLSSQAKSSIQSVVLGLHALGFTPGANDRNDLLSMFCRTSSGGVELVNWGTIRPFTCPRAEVMHDLKISFDL